MRKGWEIRKLGEVCRFINGRAYSKPELLDKGKYAVLRVGNFFTNNHWYYSDLELDPDKYCDNGDLLYAWSASFGPRIWEGNRVIYHYHIWKVVPESDIITKAFLFRLLEWDTEMIKSIHGTGTTMMHVGKGSIESRLVPVPPLPEQQRIVAILDETFEAIDQAKANTEKNLQNAKELFQSELNSIFTNKGEGWEEKKLGDFGAITSSKRIYKSEYVSAGVPFYRTKEIKELANGETISLELFIATERYEDIKKTFGIPQIGDILISAVGTIGEILVIENNDEFYFKDGNIIWLKDFSDLESNYLKYALKAFVEEIKSLSIGSAYSALTIEKLKEYKLSFPPSRAKQQRIVNQLDILSVETKQLEENYRKKLESLEELKKSILQKAFSGELTSPERVASDNDGCNPSNKKGELTSPERV